MVSAQKMLQIYKIDKSFIYLSSVYTFQWNITTLGLWWFMNLYGYDLLWFVSRITQKIMDFNEILERIRLQTTNNQLDWIHEFL